MNYFIACLKRSGQHAIINWMAQQNTHDSLHYNNCVRGWRDKELQPMLPHMVVSYSYNGASHDIVNYFVDHKIDEKQHSLMKEKFRRTSFNNIVDRLYNVEDLSLAEYRENEMWNFTQLRAEHQNILILRDPYNFIASCLQRLVNPPDPGARDVGEQLPERMKIWKEHASQIVNGDRVEQDFYFINYNEWFSSVNYRQEICNDLGLTFTDRGVNKVMNFGEGSSFDRRAYDGSAQKMSVLERYKKWQNHAAFSHLVDEEVRHYAKEIFGMVL